LLSILLLPVVVVVAQPVRGLLAVVVAVVPVVIALTRALLAVGLLLKPLFFCIRAFIL